jgi:predicted amidohydrolase
MLAPEPARAAALSGADVLVWTRPPAHADARDTARTRALENKVFTIVCAAAGDPTSACLIDPSGTVSAEALVGSPSGFVATLDPAAARDKIVVPGTDVFAARIPHAFDLFYGGARH